MRSCIGAGVAFRDTWLVWQSFIVGDRQCMHELMVSEVHDSMISGAVFYMTAEAL